MKVLFVSSANSSDFGVAPFIKSQGDSLSERGIKISYFGVKGKGISGYIKSAQLLRKYLKNNNIDIIHAHYVLSGWVAVLAFSGKPIILSLMGSDAYGEYVGPGKTRFNSRYLPLLSILIQPFVKRIICKSKNIEKIIWQKSKSQIIPNGIDIDKISDTVYDIKNLPEYAPSKINALYFGSKTNIRKNHDLIAKSLKMISDDRINLISPYPIAHEKVIQYLKAGDILLLPSFMEGSPNIVKEAMACNCVIVATNVGDVEWLFGDEPGHFIGGFDYESFAQKIEEAIQFVDHKQQTNGMERILKLGLDSKTIANRINEIYGQILQVEHN